LVINKPMHLKRSFYFLALLLAIPVYGFGQRVPVAPSLLFNLGRVGGIVSSTIFKLDAQGNMYVLGLFYDNYYYKVDFDPSASVTNLITNDNYFLAKYSPAGALVWVKGVGDNDGARDINGLDIDRNGNINLIGRIPPKKQIDVDHYVLEEYLDALVLHLDNNGNVLWKRIIESGTKKYTPPPPKTGTYLDIQTGYKVASDDAGNVIAVFTFGGSPDVEGKITAKGNYDGLVVKYDTNGNVIWKFNLGAVEYDNPVVETLVDKQNNIIIAGYTNGTVNYNPLGTPVYVTGHSSMFLAKYSPDGILQWIKNIDGHMPNCNIRLALDGLDNIYINGVFHSTIEFGTTSTLPSTGPQDMFIAKYSSDGNLLYQKGMGGAGTTILNGGLTLGPDNSLYLSGYFKGKVDLDPSASVAQLNSNGIDMYLAKYDDNGNYQWAFNVANIINDGDYLTPGSSLYNTFPDILNLNVGVNSSNEIFVNGEFVFTVNFDGTGCGVSNLTALGTNDTFIVRYSPTSEIPITNNKVTAPAVTAVCPGVDPDIITGSTPIGSFDSYQWQRSLDNKTYTDIPGAVSKDYDPPVITATTYYHRRVMHLACEAPNISNVVTITLLTPATLNEITAPAVTGFCNAGDASLIHGFVPQAVGTVDYQWQLSTDNISFTNISGATAKDYDPPSISVTTYYRRLITNSPCNIGTPSNTVAITITPVTVPTISAEQTVCLGDGVTLKATGGTRYSWSPAAGLSATDIASPTARPTNTTNYTVTVFNGNCSTMLPVKVTVVGRPTVNVGADKEIMIGDRVQLNAQVTAVEGATYSWTPTTYLDNPAIANPVAKPTANITYRLTVTSANGCFIASDEVVINVREKIVIPNAFTPNGDGINDILTLSGLESYKQSTLTIFNRNGQQVFEGLAYGKPWDGTRNGKPLPMGTYYYVIELNYDHKRLSGYIALIR
jgi:gliding motility-associated-like protein